jgi:hypothetical protein
MLLFKAWIRYKDIDISLIYPASSIMEAIQIGEERAKTLGGTLKTIDNLYLGSNHPKVKNLKR